MSIKRPWAFWRRVQYGTVFLLVFFLLGGGLFALLYEENVTCFDNLQNGSEEGVDCGGVCVRICAATVLPPKVVWTESFEINEGQYNAVAYIENSNNVAATEQLRYTFFLEKNGAVVAQRSGETVFPPAGVYPIFEGRISTDGQQVTNTRIVIEPVDVWQPAVLGPEQFTVSNIVLSGADLRPRLEARIDNTALSEARDVEIVTTLFNAAGQPLTASQTFVEALPGRSSKDIVFTWPQPITKTIRSCSIPSDVVLGIDLSGSMNNDSDTPPQPLTDAKNAAAAFVTRLSSQDQVGVVTFATSAETPVTLTRNITSAVAVIEALTITPEAEVGYTNTGAAIESITGEINSTRHNADARKAVVLLTDGLPTSQTEDETMLLESVIQKAKALELSGAELFVIGLGNNVDRDFLSSLVTESQNVYFAPNSSDLNGIYEQITAALCESGATRIDVIPKTKTNFTPLQ